jgi:UDPglucose--hexose-1-phosphate uridylyltransferase
MAEAAAQPELRRDPVTGEWVILAASRGKRPHAPLPAAVAEPKFKPDCPFCEGKESETPPEICAIREGEGHDCPGWSVRVFPNKYPILANRAPEKEALAPSMEEHHPAYGFHEVIVDTPFHNLTPWEVGAEQTLEMLEMYRERILAHREQASMRYVLVMRNHKAAGAASIEHPHSQLFALPFIPPVIDNELAGFDRYGAESAACVICDMIADEEEKQARVVGATENFIALCPYASRVPYETWILPRRHQPRFEDNTDLPEAAELMEKVLNRVRMELSDPPLNYWLHTYPLHSEVRPYHWQMEIVPRLTMAGGLEMGAGVPVNTVAPEAAAELLAIG